MPHGERFPIVSRDHLTAVTSRFVIEAPYVARAAQPGQFVMLRVHERGERIPVTIADFDARAGTVTIVVQAVGRTTGLLGQLQAGDAVLDFVGPLGEPCRLRSSGTVIGVGGGFGAAALYPVARALTQRGVNVIAVVGARSKDLLILQKELLAVCAQVLPCTDDGSAGFKGLVTEQIEHLVSGGLKVHEAVAVGPMPMMRAVAALTERHRIPTQVSLDPVMVDGTGMCGGCRVSVKDGIKFACVDGPFFDAHGVDFDELVRRGKMYQPEELRSKEDSPALGSAGWAHAH